MKLRVAMCPYCKRPVGDDHPIVERAVVPHRVTERRHCPYVSELGAMRVQNEELYEKWLRGEQTS